MGSYGRVKFTEHDATQEVWDPVVFLSRKGYCRVRNDMSKVDHFIEFISRPYFYQDVSLNARSPDVLTVSEPFQSLGHIWTSETIV